MALTEEQKAWRRLGIGGSDAITISRGSLADWKTLKAEKMEGVEPTFSADQQLRMDMGTAVEPVCLDFFGRRVVRVMDRNVSATSSVDDFFRATLDGITTAGHPIQCKFHTGDKSIEDLAEFYWPQLQHELIVADADMAYLAVLFGHYGRFEHFEIAPDPAFQDAYMARAYAFKDFCFGTGRLPEDMQELPSVPVPKIPRLRDHVWGENDNEITSLAIDWIDNGEAARKFADAEKALKGKVPEDAKTATWLRNGQGLRITVNKAGAKSIRPLVAPQPIKAAE